MVAHLQPCTPADGELRINMRPVHAVCFSLSTQRVTVIADLFDRTGLSSLPRHALPTWQARVMLIFGHVCLNRQQPASTRCGSEVPETCIAAVHVLVMNLWNPRPDWLPAAALWHALRLQW